MFETSTPVGSRLKIPESLHEDRRYFRPEQLGEAAAYYAAEGYVVVRGMIPVALCDAVRISFDEEVRHARTPILRQVNMAYERNKLDADGFLSNPIFNVQDLQTQCFGRFKFAALNVLTHSSVALATASFLGSSTKLIQSMFFEAPAGTWAHQDSYYQDSASKLGHLAAGWFALEDINAGAGRFYVCPRTHIEMAPIGNAGELDFAFGHERYRQAVIHAVNAGGYEWRAPFLAKGDVLFWSSLTVHGSLRRARHHVSRSSLTAHYLADSDDMLQFHSRIRRQKMAKYNDMTICFLHDQDEWRQRFIRDLAFLAPRSYALTRKAAIKALFLKYQVGTRAVRP